MNVTCRHCQARITIPDEKIPQDKDVTLKCPKCKEKIHVSKTGTAASPEFKDAALSGISITDRQTAMTCIDREDLKQSVSAVLEQMGFSIQPASDAKGALKDMDYHIYDLIVIDESFDQGTGFSRLIKKMNAMDMSSRRRICLLLISGRYTSNDNMAAIYNSVNSIINYNDIAYIGTFLLKILTDYKNFYTVYNESLKQAGKA